MSTQEAIRLIGDLTKLGIERIRFTGGEPFLRKDLFEILSHVKTGQFKKITIATNGLLLRKYADKINDSPITDLGVSIDGLRSTNDAIRGVDGYFDMAFEGIRKLEKKITIMTTLNRRNANELQGLFDICQDNGLMWDFNLLDDSLFFLKGVDVESIWPGQETVDFMMNMIRENRQRPALRRISKLQLEYAEKYLKRLPIREPPCFLGYTDIDIDSAGNFWTGCYVLPPVGNILESNLENLIQSDTFKKQLNQMCKRQCPGCSCGYELNISIENLPKRGFDYLAKGRRK